MAKKETKKTLRLKPGNHQFIPGDNSCYNNDNTTSDQLHWYLDKYPHINNMLEKEVAEQVNISAEIKESNEAV